MIYDWNKNVGWINESAVTKLNSEKTFSEGLKKDSIGYWWINSDGSYQTNQFKNINGNTYYFNEVDYMVYGLYTG